jgi:Skp family chaperone for outer membrane proteins
MKAILIGMAALAASPQPAAAQAASPANGAAADCFIQVPRLVAAPPGGIAELGTAIRALDTALAPQVEEVNRLRSQVSQIQQRQQAAMQDEQSTTNLVALEDELRSLTTTLEGKQTALRAAYAEQQRAIVGPVQAKIGKVAQAYAAEQGCTVVKMARPADMTGLTAASARDLTDGFIVWYGTHSG